MLLLVMACFFFYQSNRKQLIWCVRETLASESGVLTPVSVAVSQDLTTLDNCIVSKISPSTEHCEVSLELEVPMF